jgi:dihydrofolate synthase / folylpolyglutamate synthase
MGLGSPRANGGSSHPGEPGIGPDLGPPFTAPDEATRWLFSLNRMGIRPGLIRVQGLLDDLGNPEQNLRILVTAGTNGKGSTTRVLACLLQAAGLRVGTYTSPHLLNVHERILIDDHSIDGDDFARRVNHIRPLVEKHEASWFETLTALAVWIAADHQVDFLCCETGLGGRLDATNALPAVATLLTTIGLDHQRILGETLEEIAGEKLGLLKRDVPLFCGVDASLNRQVFRSAVAAGSPCHFLDEIARWESRDAESGSADSDGRWDLTLTDRRFESLPDPGTPELRRNVALSLLALSRLEPVVGEGLLPADSAAALGNLFLPGRYQTLLKNPDWIFDTAHNNQALTATLRAFTAPSGPGKKVLVFGAMYDKEISTDLTDLVSGFDVVIGIPVSLPRSRTREELIELFARWGLAADSWPPEPGRQGNTAEAETPRCAVAGDQDQALAWLDDVLAPEDRVLVTGSCFTVAEVMYRLGFTDLEMTRRAVPHARMRKNGKAPGLPVDETEEPLDD